jgi:hypothetical protein
MSDMFTFRDSLEPESSFGLPSKEGGGAGEQDARDLSDFSVEATDGSVGKVMDVSYEAGDSYLIVTTGPTIMSKRVLVPAGVVEHVDRDDRTVRLNRSKADIEAAPEFDEERIRDAAYREAVSGHYNR